MIVLVFIFRFSLGVLSFTTKYFFVNYMSILLCLLELNITLLVVDLVFCSSIYFIVITVQNR